MNETPYTALPTWPPDGPGSPVATDRPTSAGIQAQLEACRHHPTTGVQLENVQILAENAVQGLIEIEILPVGPDAEPAAGALAVPILEMLSLSTAAAHPERPWSVAVEMHLDFIAPPPEDGRPLAIRASAVGAGELAAFAQGQVRDGNRVLVHATQHSRLVDAPPGWSASARLADTPTPPPRQLMDVLDLSSDIHGEDYDLVLERPERWRTPFGTVHGGVMLAAAEAAASLATGQSGPAMRTASLSISFARPTSATGEVRFQARTRLRGTHRCVVEVVGLCDDIPCAFARVGRQITSPRFKA